MRTLAPCLAVLGVALLPAYATNVVLIVVDNLRPDLGVYHVPTGVRSPNIDAFSANSTVFTRASCSLAWCAPSRNSWLTGRRPDVTRAYGFRDSFREGPGLLWTTLPGYFKHNKFWATSVGKVFHPNLPLFFDYPFSWSELPVLPAKPQCPNNTMWCALPHGATDADATTTDLALSRLKEWQARNVSGQPLFLAVGYQGPRLPWSAPASVFSRFPPASSIPVAADPTANGTTPTGWFRPTEINQYSDVHNVSRTVPMDPALQHQVRLAYQATISHVDDQIGRLLPAVDAVLGNDTVIMFLADHGQALGEHDLWSMMSLYEESLSVPLMVRLPGGAKGVPTYTHPVELVDVFPTLASLAGLPPPPASWNLPGVDLSTAVATGKPVKDFSLGQITRCLNCTRAYTWLLSPTETQCTWDAIADAGYFVPCCFTPRTEFDVMGYSLRTDEWRFSTWCKWDGAAVRANLSACTNDELYDHRNETATAFSVDFENVNVAAAFPDVVTRLKHNLAAAVSAQYAA